MDTMDTNDNLTEAAYAKLNLCLDITGRLDDGYHSLKSVMQSVSFCDIITLIPTENGGVSAQSNVKYLPSGDKNIAVKAVNIFREETGLGPENAIIDIEKRIPVCGGLGGGSTDGAAVLRLLNRVYKAGMTLSELRKLAEQLGADPPFCVSGGTKLAEGKGEILSDVCPMPNCRIVICKPDFSISTPELFAVIDKLKIKARPDTAGLISAIEKGDLTEIGRRLFNVFELALTKNQTLVINDLKGRLLDSGALGASMSGSGSAVFGIFDDFEAAGRAVEALKNDGFESYLTRTLPEIKL